jgi:PKD repeat protein
MAATHAYKKQKSYTVTLTVTDDDGAISTQQITVRVNNVPPTVQASAAPQRIEAKKPVSFSMDGSDTPNDLATLRFEWNFGDRGSSIDRNTTHAYAIEGTYTVYGKVTDDNGASAEYKITIEVYSKATTPPPPAGPSMRLIGMIAGGIVAAVIIVVVLMLVIRSRKRGSAPPSQGQVPQVPGQAMPPGQPGVPSPSQPQAPPPGPPGHSPWAPAPFQPAPPPQVQQDYGGIIQEDAPVPQQYRNPPQNPQ